MSEAWVVAGAGPWITLAGRQLGKTGLATEFMRARFEHELTSHLKPPSIKPMDDYADIVAALGGDNQAFAGKTVLLTGSQGFLGRLYQAYFAYLNEHVLEEPVIVWCIDRDLEPRAEGLNLWRTWDISQPRPEGWTFEGLDYIICAAGLASPAAYSARPFDTIAVSVAGTDNILKLAKDLNVKSVLCFSSSEIYGDPDVVPTPESYLGRVEIYSERACYDYGKLTLEVLCHLHHTRNGVPVKVVRPFNVIGYTANDGRVLPNSVARLLRGEKLRVFLPGTQTRTFCWFTDFIAGSIKVLLHGDSRPYNIGNSDNEISMKALMYKLENLHHVVDAIEFIEPTAVYKTEPMRRCPDITRARALGYAPQVSLDDALARFWGWASVNYPKS